MDWCVSGVYSHLAPGVPEWVLYLFSLTRIKQLLKKNEGIILFSK